MRQTRRRINDPPNDVVRGRAPSIHEVHRTMHLNAIDTFHEGLHRSMRYIKRCTSTRSAPFEGSTDPRGASNDAPQRDRHLLVLPAYRGAPPIHEVHLIMHLNAIGTLLCFLTLSSASLANPVAVLDMERTRPPSLQHERHTCHYQQHSLASYPLPATRYPTTVCHTTVLRIVFCY